MAIADIVFQDNNGLFFTIAQDNSATPTDIVFENNPVILTMVPQSNTESVQKSCAHVV